MFKIDREQEYVTEIAAKLGIEARIVQHSIPTSTCMEKATLLGWEPERVVKAVYFNRPGHTVGIVTPELGGRIDPRNIIIAVLGLSKREASEYKPKTMIPPRGMEQGTCTPFPYESSILGDDYDKDIDAIIIRSYQPIEDKVVDISLGGIGEEAHMASMHIPYNAIYTILKQKFGDCIHKYSLEERTANSSQAYKTI